LGFKGEVLLAQGKYDEAIRVFDEIIQLDPQDSMSCAIAWDGKGEALEKLGKTTEANAAFARAKELGYEG